MPAQVCQSDEISNRIPSNYSRIGIQNLRPHTNLHEKYAQATLQHRYQYNKDPVPSLKLILADDEGNTLDLIAFGRVADDLNICEQGDTVVCLKFEVEACPRHYHKLYQMIADDRESIGLGSDIWIIKSNSSTSKSAVGSQAQKASSPSKSCQQTSSISKSASVSPSQQKSSPTKSVVLSPFQQTSGTSMSVTVSPAQHKSRTSKSVVVLSPASTSKSVPESPVQQKSRTSKSPESTSKSVPESPIQQKCRTSKSPESTSRSVPDSLVQQKSRTSKSPESTSKSVPESPIQQKSRTSKSPESTSKSVPDSLVQQKSRTSKSPKSTSKVAESPAQQKSRTLKLVVVSSPQSTSKSVPESPVQQKSKTSKSATALASNQMCSTSASTAVPPPQHTSTTSVSTTVSSSEHTNVKKTPSKQGSYTYRPLSEVKLNTIVDVYGVVKFFKGPIKTRGTDYCCNVSLTDPSLSDNEEKFSATSSTGMWINFRNFRLEMWSDFIGLSVSLCLTDSVLPWKESRLQRPWLPVGVYRGSVENRQASTTSYTFEQQDKEKAASLLKWWTHERGADSSSAVRKTLSQVQAREYFDLTCQVVRTCVLEPNVCRVLRVWDGTEYEGCVRTLTDEELDITTTEDVTLMKASADLAVDVFIFDNHAVSTSNIKPGDYVQFTNLHAAVVSGQTEMTLHGGTWFKRSVMVLPIDSSLVEDLKKVLDRLVEKCTSCAGLSRERIDNDGNEREEDMPSKKKQKSPLKTVGGTRKRLHESDGSADDDEKKTRSSGITERMEANVDEDDSSDEGFRHLKGKGKAPLNPRGKCWRKKKKCDDEETDDFCKKKARTQNEPSSVLAPTGENIPSRADPSMTTSRIGREKVKSLGKNNSNKNITTCETRENSSLISGQGNSILKTSRTNTEKHKMDGLSTTSTHVKETGKHSGIRTKRNDNFDDSADTSSDSFHSIWVSAYGDSDYDQEVQAQVQGRDDMVIEEHDENIQDENVTSSGGSTTAFSPTNIGLSVSTPDANWAYCDITSTSVNEKTTQNDSDGLYLELPIPSQTDSVGLDQRLTNSTQDHSDGLCQDQAPTSPADSQDSYHTALSSDRACDQNKGHSSTPHSPPSIPSHSTQKIFLSLKGRRTETRATTKAEPQQNFLEISDEDFSALESSILCFETVQFSETSSHAHATYTHVGETERENATEKDISSACVRQRSVTDSHSGCINLPGHSSDTVGEIIVIDGSEDSVTSSTCREDGSQEKVEVPTCLLRTATVMKHPHAAMSSLKSILGNTVPFKFRTLVKVQDFQPRPTTARDLIYFHCAQCQHFESCRSLEMSSDSINDRLCPRCTTEEQPAKRRAVIILKFLLTDNNRCLMAHLWDKHAVKFFNGREPEELLSNAESFRQVQQCLDDLCPADVDIKDRPWLDCCVFNYSLGQEVRYQIFDTVLVGLS